ncbi:MAG: carbohydrate porin, partial [Bacteroidota bacterium]|nr:carbohydrate porin [Bacteroidota bacterium]
MRWIFTSTLLITYVHAHTQPVFQMDSSSNWTHHFQLTVVSQSHSGFKAAYSGKNSLDNSVETGATSLTTTLFLGRKLWKGAAAYFNPEMSGGNGLSYSQGVAGALNGETYRVGNVAPQLFIARAYIQQNFSLERKKYTELPDDINQVADKVANNRITISAGKFAISDFYDDNTYSHDPRTQFLNWSLMGNGAWDYPANTRGYTFGIVAEWYQNNWTFRISSVAVPAIANAPKMEYRLSKAHSETLEIEKRYNIDRQPGIVRFIVSNSYTRAPSYQQGLSAIATNNTYLLNVISGEAENNTYGGKKLGLGISTEQAITNDVGIFSRLGWNDGKYATWAYTEIDQTASIGLSWKGTKWHRPADVVGIAGVLNGISKEHRDFLAAGGYGFIIGDGALNYGHEGIIEAYYNTFLFNNFWLTFDYQ